MPRKAVKRLKNKLIQKKRLSPGQPPDANDNDDHDTDTSSHLDLHEIASGQGADPGDFGSDPGSPHGPSEVFQPAPGMPEDFGANESNDDDDADDDMYDGIAELFESR